MYVNKRLTLVVKEASSGGDTWGGWAEQQNHVLQGPDPSTRKETKDENGLYIVY